MSNEPSIIRKGLSHWKWFFLNQKYRFDLGYQFLALLNFTLLVIAASDKLRYYTNIERTWALLLVIVPMGFVGMWFFGFFLDKVVRYGEAYNLEAVKRNPLWGEQKQMLMNIQSDLELIKKSLGTINSGSTQ